MSNLISNVILEKANKISTLLMEGDIIIDLTQLVDDFCNDFFVGYYFADEQEQIIAGKVINRQSKTPKMPKTWVTIPAHEIPHNAVSLSFFID